MRLIFYFIFSCHALSAQPLIVGMELSYPPFETVDEKGAPCGVSTDLAKELGKELNREVIIKNIPFIGLIPALKSGKIDLIISSMSITEQRLKSIDFSLPYTSLGLAALVNISSPMQELNQKGTKIAVKLGSTGHLFAQKSLPKAQLIILDKESAAVMEVIQGKVDAFLYDQLSVYTHWQKNKNTTRAHLMPLQKEYWAIGIRKGNDILQNQVNYFIKQFRAQGRFDAITDRYLKEPKQYFAAHNIPFYF
jgi:polar amino acid transport system substrate-binding protein